MAFASIDDIEGRWRTLTADEQTRAHALLEDASAMLSARVNMANVDGDRVQLLKSVCCQMVIRAMTSGAADAFGIEEMSSTVGPFGQTAKFSNPSGELYITKSERKALGIGGGNGRILSPWGEQHED